jgi:hypothetical protein
MTVDDTQIIMVGGIALMVGLGVIVVLITLARMLAARSRGGGGGNWAWNQLGYRSMGATRYGPGRMSTHYARTYGAIEVHYLMDIRSRIGKSEYASAWACPLPAPARFGLQIVEAGIADSSLGARVSRRLDSSKYNWEQKFAEGIQTGDAELDGRFAVLGTDADAAQRLLAEPVVRETLLGLKHVDLMLAGSEVRLDDPFLANSWGLDGQPLVDLHNQVAELLARTAGAADAA